MNNTLELKDVHVSIGETEILKGITLSFSPGKIHVIMGPNGSGKSTLAHAVMGHPKYKITKGSIVLKGKDITNEKPHIRAREGLFLSFQYPVEVSGVTVSTFLRTALNSLREKPLSVVEFHQFLKEQMALLKIDLSLSRRYLNMGFSGGEKKQMEILQLLVLQPTFAFLDETDSGLDVDAIKRVAESINRVRKQNNMSIIIITHYPNFLKYLTPDEVSIMYKGNIVAKGKQELIQAIEERGFESILS